MTKASKKQPAKSATDIVKAKSPAMIEFDAFRANLEGELAVFEEELTTFTVDSQDDLALLAEITASTKGHAKRTRLLQERAEEAAKRELADTKAVFKPIIDRLVDIEVTAKRLVGQYHQRKEQEQAKAMSLAAAANKSGQVVKAELALAKAASASVEPVKGMSIRYTIDIEIENEDLIPDEWWEVDIGRLSKYVRATNGEVAIPGVVYHKRPIVSSTSK